MPVRRNKKHEFITSLQERGVVTQEHREERGKDRKEY